MEESASHIGNTNSPAVRRNCCSIPESAEAVRPENGDHKYYQSNGSNQIRDVRCCETEYLVKRDKAAMLTASFTLINFNGDSG